MELPMDSSNYKIPGATHIGHVHLKVADIPRALDFYCGILGFEVTTQYGNDAVFISAGGYHHHIGLNTWYSKNAPPAPMGTTGLFHVAIKYPERKDLAMIYKRLQQSGYEITGVSDHGVSEAIYLNDPDHNGLELYWDKPRDQWPVKENGSIEMYTKSLDLNSLIAELDKKDNI